MTGGVYLSNGGEVEGAVGGCVCSPPLVTVATLQKGMGLNHGSSFWLFLNLIVLRLKFQLILVFK